MTEHVTIRLTLGQARWLVERLPFLTAHTARGARVKADVYRVLARALGERAERQAGASGWGVW